MKFLLNIEKIKEVNNKIDKILKAKSSTPILSGVLFEAIGNCILLTASDGTESIIHRLPIEDGMVLLEEEGACVIPKDCLEVVKKLKGMITFKTEGHLLYVSQEKTKTNLEFATMDAEEFPRIAVKQGTESIKMSGKDFADIVTKTKHAASTEEGRPILQGIHMAFDKNGNVFSATDSHRLGQVKSGAFDGDKKITVPAKSLEYAMKTFDLSADVVIFPTEQNIALANGNTIFHCRLLEGKYPNTSNLIPIQYQSNLVLNKEEFREALEILVKIAKNSTVKLVVSGLFVEITATEATVKGSRQMAFESYDGEENFQIGLSAKFVLDAIKTIDSQSITIGFNGPMKPFVIRPVEEESKELQLVLPVRLVA